MFVFIYYLELFIYLFVYLIILSFILSLLYFFFPPNFHLSHISWTLHLFFVIAFVNVFVFVFVCCDSLCFLLSASAFVYLRFARFYFLMIFIFSPTFLTLARTWEFPLSLQSAFAVMKAQFILKQYSTDSYCGYIYIYIYIYIYNLLIYVRYGQEIN